MDISNGRQIVTNFVNSPIEETINKLEITKSNIIKLKKLKPGGEMGKFWGELFYDLLLCGFI